MVLPACSQTFDISDFSELKSSLQIAEQAPNENHQMNITGNIQFSSAISEAINLEISGNNPENTQEFDLNGFKLTFGGADKSAKLSNLNILETTNTSGIVSNYKSLTIENSTLTGHSNWGNELVKNTAGALAVSKSKFLNNYAGNGAGINFSGTNGNVDNSEFSGNKANYGGAITATTNSVTNISSGTQFLDNKANGLGGGIFSQGTVNINADNHENPIIFSGNQDSNGSNAIHLDIYPRTPIGIGTLNVNVSNGGRVVFEDNISGVENTVVNINGTSSYDDRVYFGSANENLKSNVSLKDVSLEFYNRILRQRIHF